MKIQTMAMLAAVTAPMILGGSASAGFIGVECCVKPNEFGLLTVNVYAVFDRPGQDHMLAVGGTPDAPLNVEVLNGVFYQNNLGSDLSPNTFFVSLDPSLAYDTFVTIGVKVVGIQPANNLSLTLDWPGFDPSSLSLTDDSWFVTAGDAQGDPFDPAYFAGDGSVLIGQFSTADGTAIQGTMFLQYMSNGVVTTSIENFYCSGTGCNALGGCGDCTTPNPDGLPGCSDPGCEGIVCDVDPFCCDSNWDTLCAFRAETLCCDDGDPCNGEEPCVDGICVNLPPDPDCNGNGALDSCDLADGTSTDCNGNGVPDLCDIASGTSTDANLNGVPDDCDVTCQADFDNDGEVGITDFLQLLADWGTCP